METVVLPSKNISVIDFIITIIFFLVYLFLFETKKRGLCAFDDKRFLLADGSPTLAYGQYSVAMRVEHVAAAYGEDGANRVLRAA